MVSSRKQRQCPSIYEFQNTAVYNATKEHFYEQNHKILANCITSRYEFLYGPDIN
jgi:hypothetical protein